MDHVELNLKDIIYIFLENKAKSPALVVLKNLIVFFFQLRKKIVVLDEIFSDDDEIFFSLILF